MSLVVVSAAEFEAKEVCGVLNAREVAFEYVALGVGALEAAKSATMVAKVCENKDVLFLGSAGTFESFNEPYLVQVRTVMWLPTANRFGLAYTVEGTAPTIEVDAHDDALVSELDSKTVICGPSISLDARLPTGWNPGSYVENLELYSCAREIGNVARSFSVLLGVTNGIYKNAHIEWKDNFSKVAKMSAEFIASKVCTQN